MTSLQKSDFNQTFTKRPINQSILDKKHPAESIGVLARSFSISLNETVGLSEVERLKQTREDLYEEILHNLRKMQKIDLSLQKKITFQKIQYIDNKYDYFDKERLYIKIQLTTVRNSIITTLCRFHINGNNLYLAVDSYVLGTLKISQLILQVIVLIVLFVCSIIILQIESEFLIFSYIFLALFYLYKVWIDVLRAISQQDNLYEALRQKFTNDISSNSFDTDDSLMYLKSLFPLIINSVKTALSNNNLLKPNLSEKLETFLENGQQVINIDTGGGSILGSIFGGKSNQIKN